MKNNVLLFFILFLFLNFFSPISAMPSLSDMENRQNILEKYVKPTEAYKRWEKKPKDVKILDVRTIKERALVGHPPMAFHIPFNLYTIDWDWADTQIFTTENEDFLTHVEKHFNKDDIIMVMCRSGDRAAQAINEMKKVGFSNTYNIIGGFEGEKIIEKDGRFHGGRIKNGWIHGDLPVCHSCLIKKLVQIIFLTLICIVFSYITFFIYVVSYFFLL